MENTVCHCCKRFIVHGISSVQPFAFPVYLKWAKFHQNQQVQSSSRVQCPSQDGWKGFYFFLDKLENFKYNVALQKIHYTWHQLSPTFCISCMVEMGKVSLKQRVQSTSMVQCLSQERWNSFYLLLDSQITGNTIFHCKRFLIQGISSV